MMPEFRAIHGEAVEMFDMLKSRQWRFDDRHCDYYCDWCNATESEGHRDNCRLAAVLKAIEGGG